MRSSPFILGRHTRRCESRVSQPPVAQNKSIQTDSQFQALVHTLDVDKADLQIFLKAHNERNLAAYEGRVDIDDKLLADLIRCTKKLEAAVEKLSPPPAA